MRSSHRRKHSSGPMKGRDVRTYHSGRAHARTLLHRNRYWLALFGVAVLLILTFRSSGPTTPQTAAKSESKAWAPPSVTKPVWDSDKTEADSVDEFVNEDDFIPDNDPIHNGDGVEDEIADDPQEEQFTEDDVVDEEDDSVEDDETPTKQDAPEEDIATGGEEVVEKDESLSKEDVAEDNVSIPDLESDSEIAAEEAAEEVLVLDIHNMMVETKKYILKRIDSPEASVTIPDDKPSLVVLITPRELFIGCHSFQEYLSPDFITVFVFDEDAVSMYKLDELVKGASKNETMGAYLFVTSADHHGEIFSRKIAYDFVTDGSLKSKVEFLYSVNCDMHPLPKEHSMRVEFPEQTLNMYNNFVAEKKLRANESGKSNVWNTKEAGVEARKIQRVFAFGPLTVETTPRMDSLHGALLHGLEVGGWNDNDNRTRPESLKGKPWLIDMFEWVEGHALMMDVEILTEVAHKYFVIPNMLAEMRILPRLIKSFHITLVRDQDAHMVFDLAKRPSDLESDVYKGIDLDHMRLRNFELMSFDRHPKQIHWVFHMLEKHADVTLNHNWGPGFVGLHFRKHWLPRNVLGANLSESPEALRLVTSMLSIAGYYPLNGTSDTFYMPAVYPHTVLVNENKGSLMFLDIKAESDIVFYAHDIIEKGATRDDLRKLSKDERVVTIPLNATLEFIRPPVDTTFDSGRRPDSLRESVEFESW